MGTPFNGSNGVSKVGEIDQKLFHNMTKITCEGEENLAEIFVCLGFFMIYFIEEFVHSTCDRKISVEHCEEEDHAKAVQVHK